METLPVDWFLTVCGFSSGRAEWLFCKSRVCGVAAVIQDLDQCARYMDCTETGLIRDTLELIKPSLDFLQGHMGESLSPADLRLTNFSTAFKRRLSGVL